MPPLKLSILGIRGVIGSALTPELICDFAQAFGTYIEGGRVLVSRDTRPSGEMLRSAVFAGLLASGCEVVDLGICPTPSLQMRVRDTKATGGIAISAGHNSIEWNALKFVLQEGLLLNAYQGEELLDVFHSGRFSGVPWDHYQPVQEDREAAEHHLKNILKQVDQKLLRSYRLKVALDCCNGACSVIAPRLLEALGCEVVVMNDQLHAPFPHDPEPNPPNMSQLKALVKASRADVGFAFDADGERLGIVTEKAEALSEEYTLCILADQVLQENPGPLVTNISSTLALEVIARRYHVPLYRTRVGQAYIVEALRAHKAVLGGEGSGGVVFPQHLLAHDALMSMAQILFFMARKSQPVSQLASRIPTYAMVKRRLESPPSATYSALQQFRKKAEQISEETGASLDLTEGVRLVWGEDRMVHVRASITEPILRVIAEAQDPQEALRLAEEVESYLRGYL